MTSMLNSCHESHMEEFSVLSPPQLLFLPSDVRLFDLLMLNILSKEFNSFYVVLCNVIASGLAVEAFYLMVWIMVGFFVKGFSQDSLLLQRV